MIPLKRENSEIWSASRTGFHWILHNIPWSHLNTLWVKKSSLLACKKPGSTQEGWSCRLCWLGSHQHLCRDYYCNRSQVTCSKKWSALQIALYKLMLAAPKVETWIQKRKPSEEGCLHSTDIFWMPGAFQEAATPSPLPPSLPAGMGVKYMPFSSSLWRLYWNTIILMGFISY